MDNATMRHTYCLADHSCRKHQFEGVPQDAAILVPDAWKAVGPAVGYGEARKAGGAGGELQKVWCPWSGGGNVDLSGQKAISGKKAGITIGTAPALYLGGEAAKPVSCDAQCWQECGWGKGVTQNPMTGFGKGTMKNQCRRLLRSCWGEVVGEWGEEKEWE